MKPFVVDVYRVESGEQIRRKRLDHDSPEAALRQMEVYSRSPEVFRIVMYRRLGGGGMSKMKVWARSETL